jgi:hypothetical protein
VLPLAIFGIESSGLSLAVDLLVLFVVVLYLALIYWTYADARRRIVDPVMIACATAASLFPFVGTIVYVILRPPEYLEDIREREIETQAAEARLSQLEQELCPHCNYRVEKDFVRCPSCLRKLKERCTNCSRPLDQAWTICPYCEADVPGLTQPRPRRRRVATLDSELELESSIATEKDAASPVAAEPLSGGELDGKPLAAEQVAAEPLGADPAAADPVAAADAPPRPRTGRARRPRSSS